MGINEFLRALRSLIVRNNNISGESLKITYSNEAPYSSPLRYSTPTKYEDEEKVDNDNDLRPPSHKHRVNNDKKTSSSSLSQTGKTYVYKLVERLPSILNVN